MASLKTDGILNNVARNLADVVDKQEPANLPVVNLSNEPKFTPNVLVGEGVCLGSSSNPILLGENDVKVMAEIRNSKFVSFGINLLLLRKRCIR